MNTIIQRTLDWRTWIYGLASGVIGGSATAGGAWLGMSAAHSAGVDVPVLNFKSLGIILASAAITSAFSYLKQSPLPKVEVEVETTNPTTP